MAAALATLETILKDGILENVRRVGSYFLKKLDELKKRSSIIKEIRGRGLIIGIEISIDGSQIVNACMDRGLLINCTGGNVLRFVPPLTITETDVNAAVAILGEVIVDK
jgi:acetylornithine/succinyldiaminopimelate/putrescine aminotransferase